MRVSHVLAALAGVAVVAIGGAAAWTWLDTVLTRTPDVTSDPRVTVTTYLEAWEAGDHAQMRELVRDPTDDFERRFAQLAQGLDAREVTATAREIVAEVDGRVRVPVQVDVAVDALADPVSWQVELRLVRERGEWGVVWELAAVHPDLRPTWEFSRTAEPTEREAILAADGTALADRRTITRFGFEPSGVDDAESLVAAFDRLVPGSGPRAARELARGGLVDGWFYPVVDVIDEVDAQRVWDRLRREPGVIRRTETRRTLLTDGFAQHVVGVLAEATAEQLEQRQARGEDVVEGDEVPQYGLELALDDQLEGSELLRYGLGPPDADLQVVIAEGQTDPSRPVGTTIDTTVQRAVEAALDGIDRPAGMVVVDAADGAIRASASRPLHAYNRVFAGRYPPGSTFKIVTAEALLAAGALADDEVGCPAETIVGGLRIPNAEGVALGATTLRDAFAFSCNTTFGALAADLGADAMAAAAERFGFSTTPNVPLDVFGGAFPMPRDAAETAAAAFGQARVEASVLHMASVAAATIDGTWDRPYLIADDGPGQPSPLASGVADQLRAFLRAAVADGSGRAAAIDGLDVAGKTGTAQATGGVEHAWFVGTFDNLGFAVLVEDGGSGGAVAAPIAARFITAYAQATGQLEATTSVDGDDPGDPQEDDR